MKPSKPQALTAIIAGASGLTGSHLLQYLIKSPAYTKIHVLSRKSSGIMDKKITEHIFDYNDEKSYKNLPQADDVFCCLGTTIKKAGSRDEFSKVDFSYIVNIAESAAEKGAKRLFLISALGADSKSGIFYSRIKGMTEEAVRKLPYEKVLIFRPSLLLGNRKEFRRGEQAGASIMKAITPLMIGPLSAYRAIESETVARGMLISAERNLPGGIYPSAEIQKICKDYSIL
jgi:uncharacterized protein YbjT (DUF2867 family)